MNNVKSNLFIAFSTIISLLLLTPSSTKTMIELLILILIVTVGLLSSKTISLFEKKFSKRQYFLCIAFALVFSLIKVSGFYTTWIPSLRLARIASVLHLSTEVFLSVIAAVGFAASVISIIFLIMNLLKEPQVKKQAGLYCLVFVYVYICAQIMMCGSVLSPGFLNTFFNLLIIIIPVIILKALFKNDFISVLFGTAPALIYSTVNNYVYRFRGNELGILDLQSYKTALNVIGDYNLKIPWIVFLFWLGWIILLLIIKHESNSIRIKNYRKYVCCLLIASVAVLYFAFKNTTYYGWKNSGSLKNGTFLNFLVQINEFHSKTPESYSSQVLQELENTYCTDQQTANSNHEKHPSIIVIMDESFTDFNSLGKSVETNSDLLPFISSLETNVVKGYAYSSVYGGNTPNSEFEFLTGNTMAFLPAGSVPYQQYISGEQYSMVSILHSLNYKCHVTHPYYSSGWNRPQVYKAFGFDSETYIESYPQKNLIRGFVSDQEMFDYIIRNYEQRDTDYNYFLFGITMQNHGGYLNSEFEANVKLQYDAEYPQAEQFLSLAQLTDESVKSLLEYFENDDNPVIICFFGDHQPAIEQGFLGELNNMNSANLENEIVKYKVPFFVWANYELESKLNVVTSLNYLSNYVYTAAGINPPAYNQFLEDSQEIIPYMNALGYFSLSEESFIPIADAEGLEKKVLENYQVLQYNNIFDKKNLCEFFKP